MRNKSSQKGKSFEREISKYLSDLYGDNFLRNFDSGAFSGGKNSYKRDTLTEYQWRSRRGDIICPDDWLSANIECKSYNDFTFHKLLQQDCKQLDEWIKQSAEVSEDDIDTIIFKISRKGSYVCVVPFAHIDTTNALQYKDRYVFDLTIFFKQNKQSWANACKRR